MMDVQNFLQNPVLSGSDWPQWFVDLYDHALVSWEEASLSEKTDEAWRFGRTSMLNLNKFIPNKDIPNEEWKEIFEGLSLSSSSSHRIAMLNGKVVMEPIHLPDGLMIQTLSEYIKTEPSARDVLESPVESLGMKRFIFLQSILAGEGVVIRAMPGISIETPVEIIQIVAGDRALIAPMTLILSGENSSVDVFERHCGRDQAETAVLAVQKLVLSKGSTLRYALLQQLNDQTRCMELAEASLPESARLEHLSVHCGGMWTRQEIVCRMEGRNAEAQLISSAALSGDAELDQRTYQKHSCPGAKSNLLFKNVLKDEAKSIFSGMIRVDYGAHETDAYQRNVNLLLSDKAEADSMPGLEILADGVRCSHGTATAPIDPEQVFYLESRGIAHDDAETMIADGFLRQALESFSSEAIIRMIDQLLE